jgi:hypothetical protein
MSRRPTRREPRGDPRPVLGSLERRRTWAATRSVPRPSLTWSSTSCCSSRSPRSRTLDQLESKVASVTKRHPAAAAWSVFVFIVAFATIGTLLMCKGPSNPIGSIETRFPESSVFPMRKDSSRTSIRTRGAAAKIEALRPEDLRRAPADLQASGVTPQSIITGSESLAVALCRRGIF